VRQRHAVHHRLPELLVQRDEIYLHFASPHRVDASGSGLPRAKNVFEEIETPGAPKASRCFEIAGVVPTTLPSAQARLFSSDTAARFVQAQAQGHTIVASVPIDR
jgi:hypothetical protein